MTPDAGERRSAALPPGQRARGDLPRFGLPAFARRWPRVPPSPALRVDGDVEQPLQLDAGELAQLSRRTQTSDLHCVTTWSALGLVWSGVRFRDVYDELVVPRARPRGGCAHVVLAGRDGYRTSLPLEDALAPDVLLADRLTGEPLALEHGAPLRLSRPPTTATRASSTSSRSSSARRRRVARRERSSTRAGASTSRSAAAPCRAGPTGGCGARCCRRTVAGSSGGRGAAARARRLIPYSGRGSRPGEGT